MYPQYPSYPYYSAGMSGGYVPVAAPTYMPQQQSYYPQQYAAPPPPAVPAVSSVPSVRRLPIKDPSTGLVIPVVTSEQVEQAVADYHRNSQPSDLVDLDLEDLFQRCKAAMPHSVGMLDSADFASDLLLTAAKKGHKFSQYYVGRCYDTGKGIAGEQSLCFSWFQRSADQYVPEATYKLAQCLEDGWGCERNIQEAVKLYKEAAEAKVAAAQLRLGVMHEHGLGVEFDPKEALAYYKKGITLAEARFHVGRCYDTGIGTAQDMRLALKWYKQARDLGLEIAAVRAEEIQQLLDQAAKDAVGDKRVPLGIPPQRAKTALVKPDPKAKPFMPGANGLQRGDSGLSRSESSGSGRPDPRARPFVPPPALAAKLKKSEGGWSDSGSAKSDASMASDAAQAQATIAAKPSGLQGQLKPGAQAFQPKQADATQHDSSTTAEAQAATQQDGKAQSPTKQPTEAQPLDKPKAQKSPAKSPAKTSSKSASQSAFSGPAQQPVSQEAAAVEDLDALHTLQMSFAWAELDEATSADPPDIEAIKGAIRQARPYEELRQQLKVAESFLASLERAAGRQPAKGAASPEKAAKRQPVRGAASSEKASERQPVTGAASSEPAVERQPATRPGSLENAAKRQPVPGAAGSEKTAGKQPDKAAATLEKTPERQPAKGDSSLERAAEGQPTEERAASTGSTRQQSQQQVVNKPEASAAVAKPQQSPTKQKKTKGKSQSAPESAQKPESAQQPEAPQVSHPEQSNQAGPAHESAAVQASDTVLQPVPPLDNASKQDSQPQQLPSTSSESSAITSALQQQPAGKAASSADTASSAPDRAAAGMNVTQQSHVSTQQGTAQARVAPTTSADSAAVLDSHPAQAEPSAMLDTQETEGDVSRSQAEAGSHLQEADDAAGIKPQPVSRPSSAAATAVSPSLIASTAAAQSPAAFSATAHAHAASPSAASCPAAAAAPAAPGPGSTQDFLSFLLPAENPSAAPSSSARALSPTASSKQPQSQPSRRTKPYTTTARAPAAPYRPPGALPYRPPSAMYDPTQADATQSSQGATMSQGTSLQAESRNWSEVSQPDQSAEDVLAEILGGFAGPASRSGRTTATSQDVSRDASRSPALSPAPAPRYQPPSLSPERLKTEMAQDTAAAQPSEPDERGAKAVASCSQEGAEASEPGESIAATEEQIVPRHDHASSSSASQQQEQPQQQPQSRTDAQAGSVRSDSEAQPSERGSQQGEEEALQQSMGGRKLRAVDADYSVSTVKAGRKGQTKGMKQGEPTSTASSDAAVKSPEGKLQRQASSTDSNGQLEAGNTAAPAILPPKPKPGAPKARKVPQPASRATEADATKPSVLPLQPTILSATPSQPPAAAQRPSAPQQIPAQSPPAPGRGAVQIPCAPQAVYKPAPAAIPLPANSAWAKKLDLQSAAPASTPARPTPPSSQPQPPAPAPTTASRQATAQSVQPPIPSASPPATTAASVVKAASSTVKAAPTVKASPATDRSSSAAGAKGKGKKKGQGQGASKQPSVAQPSAAPASSSGQRETVVKEVPAKSKDSRPRASNSTVLSAPGLTDKQSSTSAGLQDPANVQQRDVKKEKEGAMNTIIQDGMRVTAANRQAWVEICQCPLSLDIMTDPVVAADGITYEQQDIQAWMNKSNISPWTNEAFETRDLTPNLLVLQLINQFNLVESRLD